MSDETYDFDIPENGLDYSILDASYNDSTKAFLLKNGLKEGLSVLEVGPGSGEMSLWIAEQIGKNGELLAIDNSPEQLSMLKSRSADITNINTRVMSAYDIKSLEQKFDLIYCRFVLHHLHEPKKTVGLFFQCLKAGGVYIGEEGVMHTAFAFPYTSAWEGYPLTKESLVSDREGLDRDGDIGIKLFNYCQQAGYQVTDCHYQQPMLWRQSQKEALLEGLVSFKSTALAQGMSEEEWQKKYNETQRVIADESQLVGFYGSIQIAATTPDK